MDDPTSKTPIHHLMDVLARIPGLLQDYDQIQAEQMRADTPNQQMVEAHRQRLAQVVYDLLSWREDWERSYSKKALPDPMSSSHICEDLKGEPYHAQRQYRNFVEERGPMLYNTALMHISDLSQTFNVADTSFFDQCSMLDPVRRLPLNLLALRHGILPLTGIACEMCRSMDCDEEYRI